MDDLIVEKLPFWQHLNDEEKTTVKANATIQKFEKGQIIHGIGGGCLGMVVVLSGEIRTYLLSEEGREITLYRMYKGDTCVLSASCIIHQITFESQMVAQSDVTALVLGPCVFGRLCEQNIYVKCFLYELTTERFSTVMWSMQQILFKGFDRRLAAFLIEEYDRTGKQTINMTHEEIAKLTSSAREVVARMLKRFSADGLVSSSRGAIELTDIDALRKLI